MNSEVMKPQLVSYTADPWQSALNYVGIPKYDGSFHPHIHSWIKQMEELLCHLPVPLSLQGAFVMNQLEQNVLSCVKGELAVGKFLPSKAEVYQILLKNFGNKFVIFMTLTSIHNKLGPISAEFQEAKNKIKFWETMLFHLKVLIVMMYFG